MSSLSRPLPASLANYNNVDSLWGLEHNNLDKTQE